MLTSDTFAMVTKEGRKLERITSEEWPRDGPWIVHVKQNEHASVIAQTEAAHKTKKSRLQADAKPLKELKVKSSWSSEEGLNAIVIDGAHYDDLKAMAGVKAIVPDRILHKEEYNWGADRIDQLSLPLDNAPYNPFTQGCGVDVYVLDTGIDANHPEFQNRPNGAVTTNIWEGYPPNETNEKPDPLTVSNPFDLDVDGHGSHVAGTVGGKTVGVARCANIYGMKVLSDFGSGSMSGIVNALNRVAAIHRAKESANENPKSVINMSLGGFCGADCANDPINMKISELKDLGIVTVVAAGNEYSDASNYSP
jgi:subtilisin family serine protease